MAAACASSSSTAARCRHVGGLSRGLRACVGGDSARGRWVRWKERPVQGAERCRPCRCAGRQRLRGEQQRSGREAQWISRTCAWAADALAPHPRDHQAARHVADAVQPPQHQSHKSRCIHARSTHLTCQNVFGHLFLYPDKPRYFWQLGDTIVSG